MQLPGNLQYYFKSRLFRFGVPFVVLVVGGSFGLKYFSEIRYKYTRTSALNRKELERLGIEMKKPGEVTLESEYEKIKDLDIDNWKQIRGPRPWEENINQ